MSITPARKVSSSSTVVEKKYTARHGEQFVEVIDTNNNVSLRSDTNTDHSDNGNYTKQQRREDQQPLKNDAPIISDSFAVLTANNIYEDEDMRDKAEHINVYSRNQSTIKDEELERTGHNYLKHFYENNQPIKEVDKFV